LKIRADIFDSSFSVGIFANWQFLVVRFYFQVPYFAGPLKLFKRLLYKER
jgi:hypothetical protein